MFLLLVAACDWGESESKPVQDLPPVPPPGPALPAPPRVGVSEVAVPPSLTLPTAVVDTAGPALVDVWVDADELSFDELGQRLQGWGLTLVDGDGSTWRVRGDAGPLLVGRLASADGVKRASDALAREKLPSGTFREGSASYGPAKLTFSWPEGPPVVAIAGASPPDPALPTALPPGAVHCFGPLLTDLQMGLVQGPGWVRALSSTPAAWAVVVEHYGFCDATGWMLLTADADVATVAYGGRSEVDDATFHELAVRWLGTPRAEGDPMLAEAVGLLSQAPDATLARAMRDVAPGGGQTALFDAFAARDAEAAMAVAAGSASPAIRAQAVGQDEALRQEVLANPEARADELLAALAGWRPGASDPLFPRLLASRDARVREAAWEARMAADEAACAARKADGLDAAGAEALYRECPQPPVRGAAFARLWSLDQARAVAALTATLRSPETIVTGIAAVRAADEKGRRDLLVEVVGLATVDRSVRREALDRLVKANAPTAPALLAKHGAWLGLADVAGSSPAVVEQKP